MKPEELLNQLHQDLRKLNVNYEAHVQINRMIAAYKQKLQPENDQS